MKNWMIPWMGMCSLLLFAGCAKQSDAPTAVQADIGTVESIVEDSGTVAHRDPYTIFPEVNGKILSCNFEEGDRVCTGDVLYVLDAGALEDQIDQAQLALRSAQLSYQQALDACDDLTVRAKAGGTVTELYCHVGDFVAAGTPIAQVIDRENLRITVPFAPADAAAIAPGSTAAVAFASYGDSVSGTVKRVYDSPSALPGGREAVYVEIAFRNPGALSGGELATASVGSAACMESGAVTCATAQALYATQSGQIESLPIDTGSAVSLEQVIAVIDNASITNARDSAAIGVDNAALALSQLMDMREDYTLCAPADGTMISRSAKAGDYAAAAVPLATLAEDASLCVTVQIDEIYIEKIFAGQEASVTFTDDSGLVHTYAAQVRRVSEAGTIVGGVTDYTVELSLDDTAGLKAGMNVSVSIVTGRSANCLRIPTAALTGSTVLLQKDGKTTETAVKCGISGGGYTEILNGLQEGDTVVYPG